MSSTAKPECEYAGRWLVRTMVVRPFHRPSLGSVNC